MRSTGVRGRSALLAAYFAVLLPLSGCLQNEGVDPPHAELGFPVALELVDVTEDAVDAPTHLIVANSNFDLSYNAATLQSYDVAAVEAEIQANCVVPGIDGEECSIVPEESGQRSTVLGNITISARPGLLASEVRIGSYAEGIAVSPSGNRVYVPVRSDADLTWVDLDASGRLSCGGAPGTVHACDAMHRETDTAMAAQRGIELPNEPLDAHVGSLADFGLSASSGDYVAVAHRAGGLSFFHVPNGTGQPVLTDLLSFAPSTLVTLTFDTVSRRFWMPTGNNLSIHRASPSIDASTTDVSTAQLLRAASVSISDVDVGSASASIRQVHLDSRGGMNAGRFYAIASRPAALLVGRVEPTTNAMALDAVLPLGSQPTRAQFVELDGHLIAFVSCYLGREVYAYDLDYVRLQTILRGASGPFEMAIDAARERLFVADFRVSVIRVYDLSPLLECFAPAMTPSTAPSCTPKALGMLGIPSTVQELR